MRNILLILCLFSSGVCLPVLSASNLERENSFQPATITRVHKQEVEQPAYSGGDNPSDAPLRSEYFAYDIAMHTACEAYVAHYESPYDYLPDAFADNHQMPVRIGKHTVDFELGYRQMQMNIIHHKAINDAGCSAAHK
jgi:hypothetical protein